MKRRKIKYADKRDVHACIEQLQALVDGLRAGRIDLQQGDQEVHLRPGGVVEFELRLDQLERRETLRLDMTWHPTAGVDEPRQPELSQSVARPASAATAGENRVPYSVVRTLGSDGQWHIDQDQLIESLARAGVDALTQQELYTLALLAEADGRAIMLDERVVEALKRASELPAPL